MTITCAFGLSVLLSRIIQGKLFLLCVDIYLLSKENEFSGWMEDRLKKNQFVNCISPSGNILDVPSHPADDKYFTNKYKLAGHSNSRTLLGFHYGPEKWLKCDERAVAKVKPSDLKNFTAYVYFFVKL